MTEVDANKTLRVAVVGAGVFGRNHLRVYRELERAGYKVELAAVIDPNEAARKRAEAEFGVRGFATIAECIAASGSYPTRPHRTRTDGAPRHPGKIDAASVCVPTVDHAATARELMASGVDVLIEKPLAASLNEVDAIAAVARERGRMVQVGHLERFNPAVRAVRGMLNRPMFFEVHRLSVFTPRALDVDVVLDLMIHDLDLVLSLVGEPVREVRAVGLPVLSPKVDIANVRLEFANGCVANFTASRVSTERVRKMRFFQPHQYLSLDFARQDLLVIDVSAAAKGMAMMSREQMQQIIAASSQHPTRDDKALTDGAPERSMAEAHPTPGMELKKMPVEQGEPLRLEIESFLNAVRTRTAPEVTLADGRAALGLALEINAAIAEHARKLPGLSC
ncbi:MAG TPA: Gfo/Idh/MocA family oxidoreductase [Acidobacteriaceae bacterium]|nr:Gfo/Idh/MocA family oxidoreductase [Acidobacteriaceae bacterium]